MISSELSNSQSLLEDIEYLFTHPAFVVSESQTGGECFDQTDEHSKVDSPFCLTDSLDIICDVGPSYLVMHDPRRDLGRQYFVAKQTPIPEAMHALRRLSLAAHALNLFDECVLLHPRTQQLLSTREKQSKGTMPEHVKWALVRLRDRLGVLSLQDGSTQRSQRLHVSIAQAIVTLDGAPYRVSPDSAMPLAAMQDAVGDYVAAGDYLAKPSREFSKWPTPLQEIVERSNKGYRLCL